MDKALRYGFGLLALLFTGYVVLTALGRDTGTLFTWITLIFSQAGIAAGVIYKQHKTEAKVDLLDAKATEIAKQTNGHMTALINAQTGGNGGVPSSTTDGDERSS